MSIHICGIPQEIDAGEATIYLTLRETHCDRKLASHECAGRLTIDKNGITLACPLCGDARAFYPADAKALQPHGNAS